MSISAKEGILKGLASASGLVGAFFLCVAGYHLFHYATETTNPGRHEYTEGVALGLLMALPFWVLVSCFIFPIRQQFSRGLYWSLNSPAITLLAAYGASNIYVLVQALG